MLHVPWRSNLVVHIILKTTLLGFMLLFYDNLDIRGLKVQTYSVIEQIVLLNRICRLYKVYFY